jgi:uncharacterized protein YcaQ
METLSVRAVRRLALARAGLLGGRWSGLPIVAGRAESTMRRRAHEIIRRFGYLQLDTVSIAGARSHAIVLASRLDGFDPTLGERLLQPGEPLFEYWGHEASWLPLESWSTFGFRRRELTVHHWWGDLLSAHPEVATRLEGRLRDEGPLPARALESRPSRGWWDLGVVKKVAAALWSAGRLAVRERRGFERVWDLTERVVPPAVLAEPDLPEDEAIEALLLQALDGHGWATTGTLAATFRLRNRGPQIAAALASLVRQHRAARAAVDSDGRRISGWIRSEHLELASRLEGARLRGDRGVLLSPFDPVLWDRQRTSMLFDFEQVLEIYTPAPKRRWGYFCLPVLAGERLVARVDLATDRPSRRLRVLACHYESPDPASPARPADAEATRTALERWAATLGLEVDLGLHP